MRALVVVSVISLVSCFYEDGSSVQVLTNDNFKSLVRDSQDIWLIEFYAPWCGHCKKLTPEFEKAAKALEGIVRLGAVDMTTDGVCRGDIIMIRRLDRTLRLPATRHSNSSRSTRKPPSRSKVIARRQPSLSTVWIGLVNLHCLVWA